MRPGDRQSGREAERAFGVCVRARARASANISIHEERGKWIDEYGCLRVRNICMMLEECVRTHTRVCKCACDHL